MGRDFNFNCEEAEDYQKEKDQAAYDKRRKKKKAIQKRNNRTKNRHVWANQDTDTGE